MSHVHKIVDTDLHFIIDPITRTIINQSDKRYLTQFDHESERFTFGIQRFVEGHDMTLCDRIEIHYTNITKKKDAQNEGVYVVKSTERDFTEDLFKFSWKVRRESTQLAGYLRFSITFLCHENEEVVYEWSTTQYSSIQILPKYNHTEAIAAKYPDLFEMLKQEIYDEGMVIEDIEQTEVSTESGGVNVITVTLLDGSTREFRIQNGVDGKGTGGNSGVYVGSGEMPEDCNVQIDPNGETPELVTKEEFENISWDQIHNRPFYTDGPRERTFINNNAVTVGSWKFTTSNIGHNFIEGQNYTVVWDGVEYNLTAVDDGFNHMYIGNPQLAIDTWKWEFAEFPETDAPFFLYTSGSGVVTILPIQPGTYSVVLSAEITEIHQIEEKYIPDTIARKSDIVVDVDSEISAESENPVQNKAVAKKFAELSGQISDLENDMENVGKPTDEQVKSAVNDYLDENGVVLPTAVEPTYDDIPKVFFSEPIPQTKDDVVTRFRYISKTKDVSGFAEFKAQGNSSMSYPKKNMTVKMYEDEALEEKLKVDFKGWGKQGKHVYKANWIDLTHARNVVSARIWADVVKSRADYLSLPELLRTSPNQGAVDGFPVKVYSQGIYQGRYTLNIPKDAWMANMDDSLDNHCILCGEGYVGGCFRDASGSQWTDEVHDSMPTSIKTRWTEILGFVMNSTDEEFKANLGNYFFIDSLIDYFIFGVISCGLDAFGKNQLYFTYNGLKWIAGMYDMDSTWGLWWTGGSFVASDYKREEFQDFKDGEGNLLYIRLASLFIEEIKARYYELKEGALSIPNIINHFERFTDITPLDLVKEDYASTTGGGNFTGIPSKTTNNIQQIRQYVVDRYAYCDEYFASLGETEPDIPVVPDIPDEPEVPESEVNYVKSLASTGTQYIDTEFVITEEHIMEIGLNNPTLEAWEGICGTKGNAGVQLNGDRFTLFIGGLNSYRGNIKAGEDCTLIFNTKDGAGSVNGVSFDEKAAIGSSWNDTSFPLFAMTRADGGIDTYGSYKLYYFAVKNTDGEMLMELKPCLNKDGVPCLYDTVGKKYLYNKGTGTFEYEEITEVPDTPIEPEVPESEVNYVKSLNSTGTQYINTGIEPTAEHSWNIKFYDETCDVAYETIAGARNTYAIQHTGTNKWFTAFGSVKDASSDNEYDITVNNSTGEIDWNGKAYTFTFATQGQTFLLFSCWKANTSNLDTYGKVKIYEFTMYNSANEPVIRLLPCLDPSGEPCMYDKVSKRFFRNSGTGTFEYDALDI